MNIITIQFFFYQCISVKPIRILGFTDFELFHNYMGKLMTDNAWGNVMEDIEYLNNCSKNDQSMGINLVDYAYAYKDEFGEKIYRYQHHR